VAARVGQIIPSRFSLLCARGAFDDDAMFVVATFNPPIRTVNNVHQARSRSRANYTWTGLSASLISTDIGDRVVYPADNVFTVFIIVPPQTTFVLAA